MILFNFTFKLLSVIIDICALAFTTVAFGIMSRRIRHFFFIGALFSLSLIILLI